MAFDASEKIVAESALSDEDVLLLDSAVADYRENFPGKRELDWHLQAALKVSAVLPQSLCKRDPDLVMAMSRSAIAAVFSAWEKDKKAADPKKRAYVADFYATDGVLAVSADALGDLSAEVDAACSAVFGVLTDLEKSSPEAVVLPASATTAANHLLQEKFINQFAAPIARGAYDFYLRERAENQLMIDPMTGLARYSSAMPVILEMIAEGKSFVYFNLDFNLMKVYNTAFGHAFVDKLLRLSAQILTRNLRGGDFDLAWRRSDKADEYGVAARVPDLSHVLRLGNKILKVLGDVKATVLMSEQDYKILHSNYEALIAKKNPDEVEIKALVVIKEFVARNQIDLVEDEGGRSLSWDKLSLSERDLEQDARLVEAPRFGWSVGAAFFDPSEQDFSDRGPNDVLENLEQRSESGVTRLKMAGRPRDLFAISDSKGHISLYRTSYLGSNPELPQTSILK